MHQPQSVWGVHVVQGAAIAVKLRRTGESGFEIESAYLEPNDGKTLPVHIASLMLARPGLKGEPAVVALPDAHEFLATVRVPAASAVRSDEEILAALLKATHFEAGHAVLRNIHVMQDGTDDIYLVAAQSKSAVAAAVHEFEHKAPLPAIAFGGAAVIRGAKALGLARDPCVLVEIESHITVAYYIDHGHVRRRSIPVGEREILKDAEQLATLAADLERFADARASAAAPVHPESRPVPFVLVGPGTASNGVRQRLAGKLGDRLQGGAIGDARVRPAADGRLHHLPVAALAGGVGAALEAFSPLEERLLVRDLPPDLHSRRQRTLLPWFAAAAGIALIVALASELFRSGDETKTAGKTPGAGAPGDTAASAGTETASGATERVRDLDRATVEPLGPGRVKVSWPAGRSGRMLQRFDTDWRDVAKLDGDAGSLEDEVPGGTQEYRWRIGEGEAATARVEVPVEVELLSATSNEGGRFLLWRTWRGSRYSALAEVAPGQPIRATSRTGMPPVDLVFDTGCRLVGVRPTKLKERVPMRVPQFRADGTIMRDADDAAVLTERMVERETAAVEAEARTGDGSRKTWTRPGL